MVSLATVAEGSLRHKRATFRLAIRSNVHPLREFETLKLYIYTYIQNQIIYILRILLTCR